MSTILIIISIIFGILLLVIISVLIRNMLRKYEFSDWEIGDKLILSRFTYKEILNKHGKKYAILKGWNKNNIYVDLHDNTIYKIEWDDFNVNKSALWRRNFTECEKDMGKKPSFDTIVDDGVDNVSGLIDGKPIELLNETECKIYLQKAIDNENYDLAENLRKQMEKYR